MNDIIIDSLLKMIDEKGNLPDILAKAKGLAKTTGADEYLVLFELHYKGSQNSSEFHIIRSTIDFSSLKWNPEKVYKEDRRINGENIRLSAEGIENAINTVQGIQKVIPEKKEDPLVIFGSLLVNQRQSILVDVKNRILNSVSEFVVQVCNNSPSVKSSSYLIEESTTSEIDKTNEENMSDVKNRVFVVHGHDEIAKLKLARFIEKIGFEAIVLHEQANAGQTIIEKFESNTNVDFGVVLYTPCDVGASNGNSSNLQSRARQNVVFEHGYLIGKLGRKNVCALVKGDIEKPSDISGVVYINMDEHDAWMFALAKDMIAAGYDVDLNLLK